MKYLTMSMVYAATAAAAGEMFNSLPSCSSKCFSDAVSDVACDAMDTSCLCLHIKHIAPATILCAQTACTLVEKDVMVQALDRCASEMADPYYAPPPPNQSSGYDVPPSSDWFLRPTGLDPTATICQTITITATRTVSVVTKIPSSLTSLTGIIDLSSFMPPRPSASLFTSVISSALSSYMLPSHPEPSTSVSGIADSSSFAEPSEVPYPTGTTPTDLTTPILPPSPTEAVPTTAIVPTGILPTSNGTAVIPTGTGVSATPGLPVFTDAADVVRVPVALVGAIGWAVLML